MEHKSPQDYVKENYKTKNKYYIVIWRSEFHLEAARVTDYSNILKLPELCFSFAVANALSETNFYQKRKRKQSGDQGTNADLTSKKSKQYQSVQKTLFQLIIRAITLLIFDFRCVVFLT